MGVGYIDFVFARILDIEDRGPCTEDLGVHADWNTMVDICFCPHPALKKPQAKAIELDYGMVGGEGKITTRKAMLFYVLKQLGLFPDKAGESEKPNVQQIVLKNKDSVYPHLESRKTQIKEHVARAMCRSYGRSI